METLRGADFDGIAHKLIADFGDHALGVARERALAHIEAGEDEGAALWWAVAEAVAELKETRTGHTSWAER